MMADRPDREIRHRLERAGLALMCGGAIVLGSLLVLLTFGAAWFISYFSDDSPDRGLAALSDVWPVWLFALAAVVLEVVCLGWLVRGGRAALISSGIGGLAIVLIGLARLLAGHDEDLRWLITLIGTFGGLALAAGALARLIERTSRTR